MLLAPTKVPFFLNLKLNRLGRADAKRYSQNLDSTATHAIVQIQSIAQAGQHSVNQAYLNEVSKQLIAISVLNESIETKKNQLADSKATAKLLSGRALDREKSAQTPIEKSLTDLRNQLASNEKRLETLELEAQQALDSWATYFNLLASIYVRKRLKIKGEVEPSGAQLPAFDDVPIAKFDFPTSKVKVAHAKSN